MTLTTGTAASKHTSRSSLKLLSDQAAPMYSVEFFHIYTDEKINDRHLQGLRYLKAAEKAWDFPYTRMVLIDNYNPQVHVTTADDIMLCLGQHQMLPDFWAYEADMVENARSLLDQLVDKKLKKQYLRYIEQHQKYPCSLLTAAWYLTRLGYLDYVKVIHAVTQEATYVPAGRLLNLLPQDYKSVEARAETLIRKSVFSAAVNQIQDLFYPTDAGRDVALF